MPSFLETREKAWGRVVELVAYDPALAPSAAVLEIGGQQFGTVISDLHMEFEVKRSTRYSENTGSFKIYNAKEATRQWLQTPGLRVRFSAGYAEQGGLTGIFWGSMVPGVNSRKQGNAWVTTIPCISSLTESTGSEDIATWAKKNSKASFDQKKAKITAAVNRIPVSLGYGPDARVRTILRDLAHMSGLVLYGAEGLSATMAFPNGWVYIGGLRGALDTLNRMLRSRGWKLYIDNTTMVVWPLDGGNLTVTAAYLTYGTGLRSLEPKIDQNIPPKLDRKGNRIEKRQAYDFECLLSPKIGPNTLAKFDTGAIQTTLLVSEITHAGNNYGGDFSTKGHGVVWQGIGDTYRKET